MLKNILAQAIAQESLTDDVEVYSFMDEEDYDLSSEVIALEETADALDRMGFALEGLSDLYLKMDARLKDTETPVSMEMGQMYYDQATTLLAFCDEEWPIATPAFESNDSLSADLHIAMEGVGDAVQRVIKKFGAFYEGYIDALNKFGDVFFARLNGIQKRVDAQRADLSRIGNTPKNDTLKIKNGKHLYIPGKKQAIPTAKDVADFTKGILQWSDMSALRNAMDVAMEASKDEGNTNSRNNRMEAAQKAILSHYNLAVTTEPKGIFGAMSSALFNKEFMASKQALMGGIRIVASIGKPKGDSTEYGRLYLSDMKADYRANKQATNSFVASAPSKKDLEDLNRATGDLIKGMINLKQEHKANIAAMDKHKASLDGLRKLPPRQLALLLAGSFVPNMGAAAFTYMLMRRWSNTLSITSRELYRHGGSVASALVGASGKGISNLK
jgi:hypothetical protein